MQFLSNLVKQIDFQIASTVMMVMAAWKWGDWKNWRYYYPTMLYYIVFDLLYALLTYNYPLWQFESPLLKTTFSDVLLSFLFFPAKILIFLSRYPDKQISQVFYILLWILFGISMETLAHRLGFLSFHHGWSIWWSLLFDLIMYPLLILHHKKPLLTLLVSLPIVAIVLIYFKIPFSSIK